MCKGREAERKVREVVDAFFCLALFTVYFGGAATFDAASFHHPISIMDGSTNCNNRAGCEQGQAASKPRI